MPIIAIIDTHIFCQIIIFILSKYSASEIRYKVYEELYQTVNTNNRNPTYVRYSFPIWE